MLSKVLVLVLRICVLAPTLAGTTILVPSHSCQVTITILWRWGTQRWNLRIPDVSAQTLYCKLTLINVGYFVPINWFRIGNPNYMYLENSWLWWQESLPRGRKQLLFKIMNAPSVEVAVFCVALWLHAWINDSKITYCEFNPEICLFLHQIL